MLSGRAGGQRRAGKGFDSSAPAQCPGTCAIAARATRVVAARGNERRRGEDERDLPAPAQRSTRAMSAAARAVPRSVPVTFERPVRPR